MREMFDPLLEGLPELIYVSDPATYELLYVNKAGRDAFGDDIADGTRPCYEALQGFTAPCPFCTNPLLTEGSFYEWEYTNSMNGRHYLLRDRLIMWEGRHARLEIAFDMTERQEETTALAFMVDASTVIVQCIRVLENVPDMGDAFDEVLRELVEFFEADRAYIFEFEGDSMSNTHEACASDVLPQKEFLQHLPVTMIKQWLEPFAAGEAVAIESVDDLLDQGRVTEYEALSEQDIHSLVTVPLEEGGHLVGYFGVDNPKRDERLDVVKTPLLGLSYFVTSRIRREEAQRRVEELIWSDSLTGALSRAAFHRDYDRGTFEDVGFLLVDADRLSVVNRERGREAGDDVLRRIASAMSDAFDRVYRIGDDEFCAVAEGVDYQQFAKVATELVERLDESGLPASAGSAWQARCASTEGLLDMAGDRMRRAKRGRHRIVELGVDLASDAAVGSLLRPDGAAEAVEAGALDIFLMPQTSCATGEVVGAEALIRYIGDGRGGVIALPTSFVLALEDMGEISCIDFFALSRACETLARWRREGRRAVPLSVNFSRLTVGEKNFVERVVGIVDRFGVPPELIEVEVTESARERSGDLLSRVAGDLQRRGFRVAIDDFGVENANFSLFVQFDFDVLKVDKSIVWNLGTEPRTLTVLKGLVALCSDLGIESVAEGIETPEQLDALCSVGCTRAQGYLVGRPAPIEEFEQKFLQG